MKKIGVLAILLVLSILLPVLVGCNSEDGADNASNGGDDTSNVTDNETEGGNETDSSNGDDETDITEDDFVEGVFVNIDLNSVTFPFLEGFKNRKMMLERDLFPFVDQYLEGNVTDLSFNIFTQISQTPSDVWMTVVDKYLQTEENGIPLLRHLFIHISV